MTTKRKKPLLPRTAARRSALFAAEKQALDIVMLDLRKVTDFTDYFIICSGVVDVHVKAIMDHIEEELIKIGWKPRNVEGTDNKRWILLDYVHFVVHIMQPDARGHYSIERLWGDAPQVKIKGIHDNEEHH